MSRDNVNVINYRVNRAKEGLEDAQALANSNSWNGVANRLYYACFYMVSALLLKNNLISKTHKGTKTLFQKEFVQTGVIDLSGGRFYQHIFNLRNEGDYEDLVTFTEAEIKPLIAETEAFLAELKTILDFK